MSTGRSTEAGERADGHHALPTLSSPSQPSLASLTEEERISEHKRGIVAAARIRSVITNKDVHIAYAALTLIALAWAFAQYTQATFTAYATSAFKTHSKLATAGVVRGVFAIAALVLVPKLTDNISRISPWLFGTMIMITATADLPDLDSGLTGQILSDAMTAGCKNVETYIAASVFTGFSSSAYEMTTQIYIAETTSIVSRAMWNVALDSFSSIITLYSGAEIGGRILSAWGTQDGWRWGYGLWCIIQFVLAVPFIAILVSWIRRVKNDPEASAIQLPPYASVKQQLFHEYDIIGTVLFVGAVALILVPLSISGRSADWSTDNIAMVCVGGFLLVVFAVWSLPRHLRPRWLLTPLHPLIPWHILRNPSVFAMFVVNLFDFMSYGLFSVYFSSYLQVAVRTTPAQAAQIDNTIRIVFQITAVIVGVVMRFWTPLCKKAGLGERRFHTKWPISIGIPICTLAMGLEINFVQNPTRPSRIAQFVVGRLLYGIGRGMFQTASQVSIQAAARRGELAIATGVFYLAMTLGGAIGQAIAGGIWTQSLPAALTARLPAESVGLAGTIFGDIRVAMRYAQDTPIGSAVLSSYVHVMKVITIAATCCQIPMLVAMLFVRNVALSADEQVVVAGKRIAMDKPSRDGNELDEKAKDEEEKSKTGSESEDGKRSGDDAGVRARI